MDLTEDQIFEKQSQQCKHCTRKTVIPYEYERACIPCGCMVLKRENELTKLKRKQFYQSIEFF